MGHQFRRALISKGVEAGRTGIPVVNVDEGPGWALVLSPNAYVRWLIQGAEDADTFDQFLETGPSSAQAVWCGAAGTHIIAQSIIDVLDGTFAADQATGQAIGGLDPNDQRPAIGARFFPSMIYRHELDDEGQRVEHAYPQWGPVALAISSSMTINGVLPAAAVGPPVPSVTILGWPPGDRGQLQLRSALPITPTISSGKPPAGVLVWGGGVAASAWSLDVSPFNFVTLINTSPVPVPFSAVWRNVGGTRQV